MLQRVAAATAANVPAKRASCSTRRASLGTNGDDTMIGPTRRHHLARWRYDLSMCSGAATGVRGRDEPCTAARAATTLAGSNGLGRTTCPASGRRPTVGSSGRPARSGQARLSYGNGAPCAVRRCGDDNPSPTAATHPRRRAGRGSADRPDSYSARLSDRRRRFPTACGPAHRRDVPASSVSPFGRRGPRSRDRAGRADRSTSRNHADDGARATGLRVLRMLHGQAARRRYASFARADVTALGATGRRRQADSGSPQGDQWLRRFLL